MSISIAYVVMLSCATSSESVGIKDSSVQPIYNLNELIETGLGKAILEVQGLMTEKGYRASDFNYYYTSFGGVNYDFVHNNCQTFFGSIESEGDLIEYLFFPYEAGTVLITNDDGDYVFRYDGIEIEVVNSEMELPEERAVINQYKSRDYDILFDILACRISGYYFGYKNRKLDVFESANGEFRLISFNEFLERQQP